MWARKVILTSPHFFMEPIIMYTYYPDIKRFDDYLTSI